MERIVLRGIAWQHTRGYLPMVATAQRFSETHPGMDIQWDKRSLQAFADEPIGELAARYDLLVIDHPWAGFAAAAGVLLPLDEHLPAECLAEQAANSVGPSHASYSFASRQWRLPSTPPRRWPVAVPTCWTDRRRHGKSCLILPGGDASSFPAFRWIR